MNRYSKIKVVNTTKSRSIDFSDLLSLPMTTKPEENTSPNSTFKTQETKQIKTTNTHESPSHIEESQHSKTKERFGVKLSRNCSVSTTLSQSTTPLESAVKRAFSMRRSSSVSERYCRIHDQCVTLASPLDDDGEGREKIKKKKRHSSGRILKACKRLFGL